MEVCVNGLNGLLKNSLQESAATRAGPTAAALAAIMSTASAGLLASSTILANDVYLEPEAVDRNFAIHLPVLDRLFGTSFFVPALGGSVLLYKLFQVTRAVIVDLLNRPGLRLAPGSRPSMSISIPRRCMSATAASKLGAAKLTV